MTPEDAHKLRNFKLNRNEEAWFIFLEKDY